MKRRRGRPKTVNRERAIELAMESYWRDGLFAVSLNQLCRRASISKPALYREFGGEDGLMEAALLEYRQRFVLPLLAVVAADLPFEQTLDQLVLVTTVDRDTPAGCLFTAMRLSQARLGPATAARVSTIVEERRAAFEDGYRRALARGEADPDRSPEFAARYLDTQLTTILVQMASGEEPDLVRPQARLALRALLPT
ncbi:MAG: TetR/AcrR family transcriptional regulator [Acidobacteriota bacterium]